MYADDEHNNCLGKKERNHVRSSPFEKEKTEINFWNLVIEGCMKHETFYMYKEGFLR